ncbi:MAG: hypothetical protein ABIQ55_09775, partial [Gemmatimonadaceae bacterium]
RLWNGRPHENTGRATRLKNVFGTAASSAMKKKTNCLGRGLLPVMISQQPRVSPYDWYPDLLR